MKNINKDFIFALDIGTRSVIGMVGYQDNDKFLVTDMEKIEYTHRVVVDGQIENIEETARTALQVKNRLEERLGFSLKDVYIAAAGRTLVTADTSSEMLFENEQVIDDAVVFQVEKIAIEKAYDDIKKIKKLEDDKEYYCVGSSVQCYYLDDYKISTLVNHKGKKIGVEMIVTFLPREVVESLYATMKCIDLNVAGLTLEPIAAMNCLIPNELRQLNVALCDIGAGTSDIAICKEGAVVGFTMVTIAGDEITEAIMRELIVDFQTGEEVKAKLSDEELNAITYEDILGLEYECSKEELTQKISNNIDELAIVISEKIIELNGEPPAALFLVGGGSKTVGLKNLVAEKLSIDPKRVAVGGNVYMKKLVEAEDDIYNPEFTTPLGIMVTAAIYRKQDEFSIKVNDRTVRLANCWETTLLGILQMCGYKYNQIMAVTGPNLEYKVNGENVIVRGSVAAPASVFINGKSAMLTDIVETGDVIQFYPAELGARPEIKIADLRKQYGNSVQFIKDGEILLDNYIIENEDEIFWLNEVKTENNEGLIVEEINIEAEQGDSLVGLEPKIKTSMTEIEINLNGKKLKLPGKEEGKKYNYFDILIYTDIDPKNPKGNIVQKLNGGDATYLSEINDGDNIEIYWEEKK